MLKYKLGMWFIQKGLNLLPEECRNGTTIDNCIKTKILKVYKKVPKNKTGTVSSRVVRCLSLLYGEPITLEMTRDILELDSLDEIEGLLKLESEFMIPLEEDKLKQCATVQDVVTYIEKELNHAI